MTDDKATDDETAGRLRREFTAYYAGMKIIPNQSEWLIADAIDRLAADVAAVKEAVCGNCPRTLDSSPAAPQPAAPPVVEVPAVSDLSVAARVEAQCYRAAMDKAGVKWKEVGRE